MISSLFSIYKEITKHFSYIQNFSSLYSVLVTYNYFFQITNFHCIYHSTRGRDEPIMLFFFLAISLF